MDEIKQLQLSLAEKQSELEVLLNELTVSRNNVANEARNELAITDNISSLLSSIDANTDTAQLSSLRGLLVAEQASLNSSRSNRDALEAAGGSKRSEVATKRLEISQLQESLNAALEAL